MLFSRSPLPAHTRLLSMLVAVLLGGALLLATATAEASPRPRPVNGCPSPTAAEVEAIGRTYFAAFNTGDVAALDALLAADYRHQGAVVTMQDRVIHLERLRAVRTGFPDGVYTIDWLIVDGDTVAIRHTFRGTQHGAYTGVAPTGRRVAVGAFHVHRIRCGQIAETWNQGDALGLFRQLGAIPGPVTTDPDDQAAPPAASTPASCPMTTRAQQEGLARLWWEEGINRGNLGALDALLAPDVVHHASAATDIVGREATKGFIAAIRTGFPDIQVSIDSVLVAGDRVVVRWSGPGTHRGEFLGVPAIGIAVTWYGIHAFRFQCGRAVESWSETNAREVLRQVGALP